MKPLEEFQHRELNDLPLDIKENIFPEHYLCDNSKIWLNEVWDIVPYGEYENERI